MPISHRPPLFTSLILLYSDVSDYQHDARLLPNVSLLASLEFENFPSHQFFFLRLFF